MVKENFDKITLYRRQLRLPFTRKFGRIPDYPVLFSAFDLIIWVNLSMKIIWLNTYQAIHQSNKADSLLFWKLLDIINKATRPEHKQRLEIILKGRKATPTDSDAFSVDITTKSQHL